MTRFNLSDASPEYDPSGPEGADRIGPWMPRVPVAVYPDSGKVLASPGTRDDRVMVRRETEVDLYDVEV